MPIINIKMGNINTELKKEIIDGVTEKMIEITGIPESSFWTTIEELPTENFGIGKKTLHYLIPWISHQ